MAPLAPLATPVQKPLVWREIRPWPLAKH